MKFPRTARTLAPAVLTLGFVLTGCGGGYECDDIAPTESLESITVLANDECGSEEDD